MALGRAGPQQRRLLSLRLLRRGLAVEPVRFNGSTIPVTASFGIAVYPRDGTTEDTLIAAADAALYAAKRAGRDRVEASRR